MIFENAYLGLTPMLRAYFGGKLVWEKAKIIDVLPETKLLLTKDDMFNLYTQSISMPDGLIAGNTYVVIWDGTTYVLKARDIQYRFVDTELPNTFMYNAIGNATLLKQVSSLSLIPIAEIDTKEEFLCNYADGKLSIMCSNNNEHTIRIYYEKLEN